MTPRTPSFRAAAHHRGFSLLELIAVLAIVAVLASLLLPRMIKRMDEAARRQEVQNLKVMRDALLTEVRRNKAIPSATTWAEAVAQWSALPATQVSLNARGYQRLYFTETDPNPLLFPNEQTSNGAARPAKLRAIMVSTLRGPTLDSANCPAPNGGTLSEANFTALWNTPDGTRPTTGGWENWAGDGDDFLVQRMDYAPLFHRLVLVNRDNEAASFTIDDSADVTLLRGTPNVGWDAWYVDGTVLGLGDQAGTTLTLYVISRDISFVYEGGSWRGDIVGMNTGVFLADDFGAKSAEFLRSQWNPRAQQGADQQGVLTAMYSFMYTYTLWADQCPHFPTHGATAVQVPEFLMLQSIGDPNQRLDEFTTGLVR